MTPLSSASLEQPSTSDLDVLLANARNFQGSADPRNTLLRGKKLALLCEAEGPDGALFRDAAAGLGAHVSHIRPRLEERPCSAEDRNTAPFSAQSWFLHELSYTNCSAVGAHDVALAMSDGI